MGFRKEKIKDYFLLDTNVENMFINEYMASAPGDFVKIYLFALMYCGLDSDLTNEDIARHLNLDIEDVLKAWTYWERMGVIRKIKDSPDDKFDYSVEFVVLKEQLYGDKTGRKGYSSGHNLHSFMEDKEIRDMFGDIEQITGRVLNAAEMNEIVSWIDDFQATPEIITYGYSYCMKKKKKSIKYIEAVIKKWAGEGLRDAVAVEKYLSQFEKKQYLYKRVFQALGFARNATEEEKKIMDSWFETMGFSIEKVLSACSRTSGISNPNINYVNKILVNWYEEQKSGAPGSGTDRKELTTSDIMKYYEVLRLQEEEEAEERRKEVFEAVPRIREIEDRINAQGAEISKIIISDRVDRKAAMEELKSKMDALNTEKAFLLTDNGFELDYMDVHYSCPKCKDTGMLETGERCQCFGEITKEKIRLTIKPRKAVQ